MGQQTEFINLYEAMDIFADIRLYLDYGQLYHFHPSEQFSLIFLNCCKMAPMLASVAVF